MQCEQVEKRLNEALDRRWHWSRDRDLFAHCASCERCRSIAEKYAACHEFGGQVPSPSYDFANRVLAELRQKEMSESAPRTRSQFANFRRISWQWFAVAATLLVAATIALRYAGTPDSVAPLQGENALATAWPIQVELDRLLGDDRQFSEVVWHSTGREFAKLPHQVRRAAELTDSSHLTGAIRPVAAAWQSLRRVLPGDSMQAEPATGETSFYSLATEAQWA